MDDFPAPVLCLDIGSGTQDVLLYFPDREIENCPKFVLPTPSRALAERIRAAARRGANVHIGGTNAGGGFGGAVREHLAAGLRVSMTESAAYSLADDPDRLRGWGVTIRPDRPEDAEEFVATDFDPEFWTRALAALGLPRPALVTACAQDHGFHPGESNRIGRFKLWERLLGEAGGRPESLLYTEIPPEFTRLAALRDSIGGGPVADTGAAAVLGALFDPGVRRLAEERGVVLVNVGNSHAVAFLLFRGRIHGVYEHHTGLLDAARLWDHLARFRRGELSFGEVFDDRGHGVLCRELPAAAGGFAETLVIGPRRDLLSGRPVAFPAPGGDMMLTGAFGMVEGLRRRGLAR